MKNIHLIPTDKPSRLHITDTLNLYPNGILRKSQGLCKNQHIYITSDEEIKEGGWHYNLALNYLEKTTAFDNGLLQQKIILTTDQDLIADGIQAIDDEFLEWFVKNPSCKWVKVEPLLSNNGRALFGYKIIILKEEAKQRAENYMSLKGALEPKDVVLGYKTSLDAQMLDKIEPKQETLEEAFQKYVNSTVNRFHVEQIAFIAGAKWQEEKSYSEEEVLNLIFKFTSDFDLKKGIEISIEEQKKWFKQLKNK